MRPRVVVDVDGVTVLEADRMPDEDEVRGREQLREGAGERDDSSASARGHRD